METLHNYKDKFYLLLETKMGDVKTLINEGLVVGGRETIINNDGTVSIKDKNGKFHKIRMSTKLGNINVVKIESVKGGYNITGKSGRTEFVEIEKIRQIISFVDKGRPSIVDSGSPFIPNIKLQKV